MEYPFDLVSIVRNKTFTIEQRFSQETEESPLKIFNHFSRFVFTNIANGKAVSFNLHIDEIPAITKRTDFAFNKYMEFSTRLTSVTTENRPAYNMRFRAGALKGKSPAEVLIEKGTEGKKLLNEQFEWLSNNLDKFPKNKELMDAIVDAASIDLSNVDKSAIEASPAPITIYNVGCRPLQRKKREDGKCLCYEGSVVWDCSRNYPVTVQITQYYAVVEHKDNGLLNVMLSTKDAETKIDFSMTVEEWLYCVEEMNDAIKNFKITHFMSAVKMSEDADKENREKNKVDSSVTTQM